MERKLKITIVLLLMVSWLQAQIYNFQEYGVENGLVQSQVYTVTQDDFGFLWVGTFGGVSRFDGTQFQDLTTTNGLINNMVLSICTTRHRNEMDKPGEGSHDNDVIWMGTHEGLTVYRNNNAQYQDTGDIKSRIRNFRFEEFFIKEGIATQQEIDKRNVDLIKHVKKDQKGNILLCFQRKGVLVVPKEKTKWEYLKGVSYPEGKFLLLDESWGMVLNQVHIDRHNNYWFATNQGTFVRFEGTNYLVEVKHRIKGSPFMASALCEGFNDDILLSDKSGKLFVAKPNGVEVDLVESSIELPARTLVDFMYKDSKGIVWCGKEELISIEKDDLSDKKDNILVRRYESFENVVFKCGTEDREGNLWFGTFNHGLIQYRGKDFETYTTNFGLISNKIRAVEMSKDSTVWFATNKGINYMKVRKNGGGEIKKFKTKRRGVNSFWSIKVDSKDRLWAGTGKGLYFDDGKSHQFFTKADGLPHNAIMSIIETSNGEIWVSTFMGLARLFEKEPGKFEITAYSSDTDFNSVHNIKCILENEDGTFWIGGKGGLILWDKEKAKILGHYTIKDGLKSDYVKSIIRDVVDPKRIWLSTGHGIARFDGKEFKCYTTESSDSENALTSDSPSLILFDNDENKKLWIGHNKGLDRVLFDNDLESIIDVITYSNKEGFKGGECYVNAVKKDPLGGVWFGTLNGAIRFNEKEENRNYTAPNTHITGLQVFLKDTPLIPRGEQEFIYKENHLTFYFTGISLQVPEKVTYRCKLEGFDEDWLPKSNRNFQNYTNLPPGDYTFKVKACNNYGICTGDDEVQYSFKIGRPFWQKVWFIVSCILLFLVLLGFFVRLKINSLEERQRVLSHMVEDRTKQLHNKNKELEKAFKQIETNRDEIAGINKDLTDSIRYAKSLQEGILPSRDVMNELLPNSYVFFRPKDIVSGDFYWVNSFEDKVMFAAVDCTGHGVPGAFMSIFAYNLLNRAVNEFRCHHPAEVLDTIQELSHVSFNNYNAVEKSTRDGMDVAMCSIDKSLKLEYAGAYNPIYIYRNHELIEIKADKQPIEFTTGEQEKPFNNHEFQLEKGDTIYLFTDGFQDQFGGVSGKKLKRKGFRELLTRIGSMTLIEQRKEMEQFFDNWKKDHFQVDDVLVFCVQV